MGWGVDFHMNFTIWKMCTAQQHLSGEVRIRISAGLARITGRRSPYSLYDDGLATYSDGDTFDRSAAEGFLKLYSLPYQTIAAVQQKMKS